jgi:hypothetical protein
MTRHGLSTLRIGSRSWASTFAAASTGRAAASCSSLPARNRSSGSESGSPPRCVLCTARTRPRWCLGSTPLFGAGRPTTGAWSPAGSSPAWTTTSGTSPTGGPGARIRTSPGAGSRPGTSACSTSPGRTAGCSATATAAPTSPSSPGPRSSGMSRSAAEHPQMTPPRPSTGPAGGARRPCPWTSTPPGSSEPKADAARSVGS